MAKLVKEMASMNDEYVTIDVFTHRVLEPLKSKPPLEKGSSRTSPHGTTMIAARTFPPAFNYEKRNSEDIMKSWNVALIVEELDNWRQPFIDYFKEGTLPKNKSLTT